jgi:hypothetical protein
VKDGPGPRAHPPAEVYPGISGEPPLSCPHEQPCGLLVIVPCGKAKIWARHPQAGPVVAADAYVGAPFSVNRRYAERMGGDWVILSAKYGFLRPADVVPGAYDTTFTRRSTNPIGPVALREQVEQMRLGRYDDVIGLGGKEYRATIDAAFEGTKVRLSFPFAGLPIGRAMAATKLATPQ